MASLFLSLLIPSNAIGCIPPCLCQRRMFLLSVSASSENLSNLWSTGKDFFPESFPLWHLHHLSHINVQVYLSHEVHLSILNAALVHTDDTLWLPDRPEFSFVVFSFDQGYYLTGHLNQASGSFAKDPLRAAKRSMLLCLLEEREIELMGADLKEIWSLFINH